VTDLREEPSCKRTARTYQFARRGAYAATIQRRTDKSTSTQDVRAPLTTLQRLARDQSTSRRRTADAPHRLHNPNRLHNLANSANDKPPWNPPQHHSVQGLLGSVQGVERWASPGCEAEGSSNTWNLKRGPWRREGIRSCSCTDFGQVSSLRHGSCSGSCEQIRCVLRVVNRSPPKRTSSAENNPDPPECDGTRRHAPIPTLLHPPDHGAAFPGHPCPGRATELRGGWPGDGERKQAQRKNEHLGTAESSGVALRRVSRALAVRRTTCERA